MTKEFIFDMDGTIADLYAVPDWLEKLRKEDVSPYVNAAPMYDMEQLAVVLNGLREMGYKISVVSWASKDASRAYSREIRKAKLEWCQRYDFPYDEIHVVKYGFPKQNFISCDISILIDDNNSVREAFLKSKKGNQKYAIDAENMDILSELMGMLGL